ncbi:damage-inducible protein J [Enterococcus faecium]|nr:damage-inducible protein J [Enterococcus faecium]
MVNIDHILDCLDRYQKGKLSEEQIKKALTLDEKAFLIMNQGFLETDEEDYDMLNWLDEEAAFFMVIEVDERLCREAESVLDELGVEMPIAIEHFLKQLIETEQLPAAIEE